MKLNIIMNVIAGIVYVQREVNMNSPSYNLTIQATEITSGLKATALLLVTVEVGIQLIIYYLFYIGRNNLKKKSIAHLLYLEKLRSVKEPCFCLSVISPSVIR